MIVKLGWPWNENGKGPSENIGKPRKQGQLHKEYILQEFNKIPQAQTKLSVGWDWAKAN